MLAGGVDGGFDALEHQPATAKVGNVPQPEYPAVQASFPESTVRGVQRSALSQRLRVAHPIFHRHYRDVENMTGCYSDN